MKKERFKAVLTTKVLYPVHALKTLIEDWEQEEHNRQMKLCRKRCRDEDTAAGWRKALLETREDMRRIAMRRDGGAGPSGH